MEDNPRDNTEFPVVLGYRMSLCRRLVSILLTCALMVPILLAIDLADRAVLPSAHHPSRAILLLFAVCAGVGLARWVIAAFDCGSRGIIVANALGEVRGIPWEDVRRLRRLAGPIVALRLRKGWYLLPGMPKPVMARLISILRETSNARITGFD